LGDPFARRSLPSAVTTLIAACLALDVLFAIFLIVSAP
jgi:hypothetical protein